MNLEPDSPITQSLNWLQRLFMYQGDVLVSFQLFLHEIYRNRPGPNDQFKGRCLADCPRQIHRRLDNLIAEIDREPSDFYDHLTIVELANAISARPIHCVDRCVLTAYEALPEWAVHVRDVIGHFASATWNYPDSAPSWACHTMTEPEWRQCWEDCQYAAQNLKPVSIKRLQWAEAKLQAEWNLLLLYVPDDGHADKVRQSVALKSTTAPTEQQLEHARKIFSQASKATKSTIMRVCECGSHVATKIIKQMREEGLCDSKPRRKN